MHQQFHKIKKEEFFKKVYPNLNVYEQAKVLVKFQKDRMTFIKNLKKRKKVHIKSVTKWDYKIFRRKNLDKCLK